MADEVEEMTAVEFRAAMIEKHGAPDLGVWVDKVMDELATAGFDDPLERRAIARSMAKYRP